MLSFSTTAACCRVISRPRSWTQWLGIVKPDPAIYQACLDRLNVASRKALFVDDRLENVEAAAQLGWQTLHFTGEDVVARLRAMVGTDDEP